MLGAFSVGKTCLVRRFVESIFSETYLTTVGVKIDKKTITKVNLGRRSVDPRPRGSRIRQAAIRYALEQKRPDGAVVDFRGGRCGTGKPWLVVEAQQRPNRGSRRRSFHRSGNSNPALSNG